MRLGDLFSKFEDVDILNLIEKTGMALIVLAVLALLVVLFLAIFMKSAIVGLWLLTIVVGFCLMVGAAIYRDWR